MALRARSIKARPRADCGVIVPPAHASCSGTARGWPCRASSRRRAGRLSALPRQDVQTDARPVEDDDTVSSVIGAERIRELIRMEDGVRDLPQAGRRRASEEDRIRQGLFRLSRVPAGAQRHQPAHRAGPIRSARRPTGAGKSSIISLIPRFYDPLSAGS